MTDALFPPATRETIYSGDLAQILLRNLPTRVRDSRRVCTCDESLVFSI